MWGKQKSSPILSERKIVNVTSDKLVRLSEEGRECCQSVGQDDKATAVDDTTKCIIIRVTTGKDDRNVGPASKVSK